MVIGFKQSKKAINSNIARRVLLAQDCDDHIKIPIITECHNKNIPLGYISTMQELGKICKIDVSCAVAVVVDENSKDLIKRSNKK